MSEKQIDKVYIKLDNGELSPVYACIATCSGPDEEVSILTPFGMSPDEIFATSQVLHIVANDIAFEKIDYDDIEKINLFGDKKDESEIPIKGIVVAFDEDDKTSAHIAFSDNFSDFSREQLNQFVFLSAACFAEEAYNSLKSKSYKDGISKTEPPAPEGSIKVAFPGVSNKPN